MDPHSGDPLRDPRRLFEAIISQVRDYAIYTIDTSGRPTSWNEGVRRVLGFEEHEFIGTDIAPIIFTPDSLADGVPEREFEQARRTGQGNNDRWLRRKDGTPFYAAGTTTAIRDEQGRHVGYVKVTRDQTQWKETQTALQRSVEELEHMDRMRGEFIAVLAHELRNPLAPLSNAIQILKRCVDDPARILATLPLMERQLGQMTRLITDLMDMSRLAHDKIELQRGPVELSSVVQQALEVVRPQGEALRHDITVSQSSHPLYVDADSTRLVQILVNLLNNAFKFTPPRGRIWVSTELEGGEAVVRVRDSGVGIPPGALTRIFEMFSQVDSSRERSRGGLGIGLALVRKLVELHGGTVQADSSGAGMGSEFIVRLPRMVHPPVESGDETAGVVAASTVRRILVVDDNEDAARSLAALLELEGHHASIANDGLTAMRIAATEHPELVILDIGMPGMNGLKVASQLRQHQHDPDPVLVALSGWDQPEDRRLSADAGFHHHLAKPADAAALREILASLPSRD